MTYFWLKQWAKLYAVLSMLLLLTLAVRSCLYSWRTLNEFIHPNRSFHPEITECSTELLGTEGQLRGLYNYRSLGKPCQKK